MTPGELLHRGSSKDVFAIDGQPDAIAFEMTDRVSVFDYGALPESIPGKGQFCARFARALFVELESAGFASTYLKQEHSEKESATIFAKKVWHPFVKGASNSTSLKFLPIELVFRLGAPEGSSYLRRNPFVKANTFFEKPLIEFFTKLEPQDRLLPQDEALMLIGSDKIFSECKTFTENIAIHLSKFFQKCGLKLWDGKIECAWDEAAQKLVLVDAFTPDELRLTLPGLEKVPLSKELLRQWLGQTLWSYEVKKAKASKLPDWKKQVPKPPKLGAWRTNKLASLYEALAICVETRQPNAVFDWVRKDSFAPKVHVMGQGGRETAVRWRLTQEGVQVTEHSTEADAVWVSQDADLARGKVDELLHERIWAYGPTKQAACVEWSKEYGRRVAELARIPIPQYTTHVEDLEKFSSPPVVKCDGLAAGKGVVVAQSFDEARAAIADAQSKGTVLLEEQLKGPEASIFFSVRTDFFGTKVHCLGSAKDFKRRFAHDEGPNTGGMGAYSPHPDLTPADIELFTQWAQATAEVLANDEEAPYNGILYVGALKDQKKGWHLIEYNARLGDPETQALVLTWGDRSVLRPLLQLSVETQLKVEVQSQAICLALVRAEYPKPAPPLTEPLPAWSPKLGPDFQLFLSGGTGGRVAYIVGRGKDIFEAGDRIFEQWVEAPWRNTLEWRADILP